MIVSASMLVVGDHEQGGWPRGRLADGLPDVIEELLACNDIVRRMLIVRVDEEGGLKEGILRKCSGGAVTLEPVKSAEPGEGVGPEVREHQQGERRNEYRVVVDAPVGTEVFENIEDVTDIARRAGQVFRR